MKKRHRNKRTMNLSILVGIVLCISVFVGLHAVNNKFVQILGLSTKNTQAVENSLPSIFKDQQNGLSLSIQLAEGQSDVGAFDLFVPQKGYYHGVMPLLRSGSNIVHPQGSVDAQLYPLGNGLPVATGVRMEGEIDTDHMTASVNVWIANKHYILVAKQADSASAAPSVKKVLALLVAKDWPSFYDQLSSEVQSTMTETQFADLMAGSSKDIVAADLDGAGQIQNVSGNTYDQQPVTLTVRNSDGSTTIFHSKMYFIWENGAWKFLSTDTPKQ